MGARFKIHGPIGIAVFVVAIVMMRQGQEPFTTYFYCFAWWSYILVADALVYWMRGESLLVSKTRVFLQMIPLSVFVWCIYEGFNFRLENWQYVNVPHEAWKRWVGYAAAYGTVLPGLCETSHLLRGLGMFQGVIWKGMKPSPRFLRALIFVGGVSLLGALLLPRYCFPLVWIGFAFLLEPFHYRYGGDSILEDIEKGELRGLLTFLIAGLVCGFLWEFWNFWAPTKWVYTVPFFEEEKLFEMPLLGYLGFPPFSVSAYGIYRFLLLLRQKGGIWVRGTIWVLLPLFCFLIFVGIDRYTVASHIPIIRDLTGVQGEWKERLRATGMKKIYDLLRRGEKDLVDIDISPPEAQELVQKAELIGLKGMGMENYRLLRNLGVGSVGELAQQDPSGLYLRLKEIAQPRRKSHRMFTPAIVRLWVREAKRRTE